VTGKIVIGGRYPARLRGVNELPMAATLPRDLLPAVFGQRA
jgi:hypothetical protein